MISESAQLIASLADHFTIEPPKLALHCGDTSLYHHSSRTIFLAASPWRGIANSILHEFAHALAFDRGSSLADAHGQVFRNALVEVTTFHYGDPKKYDWETEYESVREQFALAPPNVQRQFVGSDRDALEQRHPCMPSELIRLESSRLCRA